MRNRYRIALEQEGTLIYTDANTEYTFPVYERGDEIVIADFPSRRRVFLILGWFTVPKDYTPHESALIVPRLMEHFQNTGRRIRILHRWGSTSYSPIPGELLEDQNRAVALLQAAGCSLMSDFTSTAPLALEWGLEVSGIPTTQQAEHIAEILRAGFPHWHYRSITRDTSSPSIAWTVSLHMFPRCPDGACS